MHEYHYEPHLQLEQVYTVRNSQVLDTLESKEGGWGDIIQCKLSMSKTPQKVFSFIICI